MTKMHETEAIAEPTAAQLMTKPVLTAEADWTLDELSAFLDRSSISGAPVIDNENVVGLVSVTDLARRWQEPESAVGPGDVIGPILRAGVDSTELGRFRVEPSNTTRVREVMTPLVFSVAESATASEVARMMTRGHIHRVLVMDAGRILGIITSMDLLRLVAGTLSFDRYADPALACEGCAT